MSISAQPTTLDTLRPEHPRLYVLLDDFESMRERRATDAVLDAQLTAIESGAEALLDEPLLKQKKVGRRMLGVSRTAFARITALALAYHSTGQARFADRAVAEMRNVVGFSDWNPQHYLDVAEMAAAVAIGYDWLYHRMPEETRAEIRDGLVRHAIGLPPSAWGVDFRKKTNNWNSVCFGGMLIAALAVAEYEPALAQTWLAWAKEGNPRGLAEYGPDGVYPEGPGYWAYGTTYKC